MGEKTAIEQIMDILEINQETISNKDEYIFYMMIAANDVGYIPKMKKMAEELGLSYEEMESLIDRIDQLEALAKVPMQIGMPRTAVDDIPNVERIAQEAKRSGVDIAQEAVDKAYIYDDRFIWIDLKDFNSQREVQNILYKMGKYVDMAYNNVVISSIDAKSNRRIVYFGNRALIEKLNEEMKSILIRWSGGEPETGFFGIQLADEDNFEEVSERMRYFLEEEILGYHRIVKNEDIIASKETPKYGKHIRVHEISNPRTFHRAISESQKDNPNSAFVYVYPPEQYAEKRLFLVNAGCAGCAVTKDGDIVSVFKNSDMAKKDDVERISSALLLTAIENGGKKLDCFNGTDMDNLNGFLCVNYIKHGFIPVCKVPFDRGCAPDGWNYEKDGEPYIIFFRHNGKSVEEVLEDKNNGKYETYDINNLPTIIDYDEAAKYRDAAIAAAEKENGGRPDVDMKGYTYDED